MPSLDHLQREFFKALLLPLRGSSRNATSLAVSAERHSPEFFRLADELIKPGPSLRPAERLELYHRQYWFRLLDSLAEDFPVLRRMAGEATFWNLIEGYLLAVPSRSFTLRHLGGGFSSFIGESEHLTGMERLWFRALASVEYALMEVFECSQAAIPKPEDFASRAIVLQEHLQILCLPVPVDLCWEWEDFTPAAETTPAEIHLAVWRGVSGRGEHARIESAELPLLEILRNGMSLAGLFEHLPDPAPSESDVTRWFANWQSRAWLGLPGETGAISLEDEDGWQGMDRMSSQAVRMDSIGGETRGTGGN